MAETNNFEIILAKDDLDGLPDDIVILAKEEADKKYKETKDKIYKNKYILHLTEVVCILSLLIQREGI